MTESVGSGGDSALALASAASVRSAARPLSNSEVIQSRSMEVGITCDPLRLRSCLWPVLSAAAAPTSCLKAVFAGFDGRFTFGLRLSRRELHVPGEPHEFQRPDDPVADVDLPSPEAVAGRGREHVVGVVSPLPQGQDPEHGVVPALVAAPVRPQAPEVAGRINAPGHVVDQEDADQPAPDEAGPDAYPGPRQQSAQDGRDDQAEGDPQGKEGTRHPQGTARFQVQDVAGKVRKLGLEEPADVGTPVGCDRRMMLAGKWAAKTLASGDASPPGETR